MLPNPGTSEMHTLLFKDLEDKANAEGFIRVSDEAFCFVKEMTFGMDVRVWG